MHCNVLLFCIGAHIHTFVLLTQTWLAFKIIDCFYLELKEHQPVLVSVSCKHRTLGKEQKDQVIYIIRCCGMFYSNPMQWNWDWNYRNEDQIESWAPWRILFQVLSLQALNRGKGLLPEPNAMQILTGLNNPATLKMLMASLNPGHKQGASSTLFFNCEELLFAFTGREYQWSRAWH